MSKEYATQLRNIAAGIRSKGQDATAQYLERFARGLERRTIIVLPDDEGDESTIKTSGEKMATLAGSVLNLSDEDLAAMPQEEVFANLRSLAASVLSQREAPE